MERIFDVPAHPLLVHFPAVVIPVVTLAALALAIRPSLRTRWAVPTMALTIVTAVATWFAAQSGAALADAIDAGEYIDTHEQLGRTLQFMMVGQVVLLGAYLFGPGPLRNNPTVRGVVRGLVGLLSILALVWVIRTGHEGASVHWEGFLPDDESATAVVTEDEATESETTTTTTEPVTTTSTTETTSTSESTTTEAEDTTTTTRDLDPGDIDGMTIYESNCARCHAADGTGGRGPSLVIHLADHGDRDAERIQIVNGGSGMPAFGNRLTAEEIEAVIDYYWAAFGDGA